MIRDCLMEWIEKNYLVVAVKNDEYNYGQIGAKICLQYGYINDHCILKFIPTEFCVVSLG